MEFPFSAQSCAPTGRMRAGVGTLELILVTPGVVIIAVATLQFGTVHLIQAAITHAATEGAREAGKDASYELPNNLVKEVAVVVDTVLEPHGIDVADTTGPTPTPQPGTRVILEIGSITAEFGDPAFSCSPPASPTLSSNEVRVTVCVKLEQTPIIDVSALSGFGFSFPGDHFQISAVSGIE